MDYNLFTKNKQWNVDERMQKFEKKNNWFKKNGNNIESVLFVDTTPNR